MVAADGGEVGKVGDDRGLLAAEGQVDEILQLEKLQLVRHRLKLRGLAGVEAVTSTFYTPEIRPLYTPVDSHGTYGFRREPRRAACDRNRDCPRKHRGGAFSGARCSGQCAFRQRRNRAESHSLKLEYILFKPPAAKTAGGLFLPEVRLSAAKL